MFNNNTDRCKERGAKLVDDQIFGKVDSAVEGFLKERPEAGYNIWRGLLVDLQSVMELVIPYDIRYGGIPSFYEAGMISGERFGKWLMEKFDLKDKSIKERVYYLDLFVSKINLGDVEFIKGEENRIQFKGGTMFAKDYKKVGRNVCYHAAGFIAGATGTLSGGKFEAKEVKCVAAGDESCEFVIKPVK